MAQSRSDSAGTIPGGLLTWQIGTGLVLLALWEWRGRGLMWVSQPSLIAAKLAEWFSGEIYIHLWTTAVELVVGLMIGTLAGVLLGLVLGRARYLGNVLRPIIVALYSVPLVSLAPLFIMFFGVEMMPKIVLVSLVVFFLLFFNTFAGVDSIDEDLVASLELMGARRLEVFRKVVMPACMTWVMTGIKIALPYALVATITGEILSARYGLGYLLKQAAQQYDMTSLYAVLLLLMVVGLFISEIAVRGEQWLLRWRNPNG
jgi:NitT/TauT family transport system permease protein